MTKQQLKNAYVEWNREITKLCERKDEIFSEMKELNFNDGDGNRWCSLQTNFEGIIKHSKGKFSFQKAFNLFEEYNFISGQHDALLKLATKTNNFEIKKGE